jgi:hypothetical protein
MSVIHLYTLQRDDRSANRLWQCYKSFEVSDLSVEEGTIDIVSQHTGLYYAAWQWSLVSVREIDDSIIFLTKWLHVTSNPTDICFIIKHDLRQVDNWARKIWCRTKPVRELECQRTLSTIQQTSDIQRNLAAGHTMIPSAKLQTAACSFLQNKTYTQRKKNKSLVKWKTPQQWIQFA